MAQSLPRDIGVRVSGLVLISPALDLSALHQTERDLLAAAFILPSYAATAAAYAAIVTAAERFALSDYLVGLAELKGQPPAGDPFIARVAGIAGNPARHRPPLSRPDPAPRLCPRDQAQRGRGRQPL